jgi:hypothetical protein
MTLFDPATVARNLESMCSAEQWMRASSRTLNSRIPLSSEYSNNMLPCVGCVERSRKKSDMLQGYGDTVLYAEAMEK